MQKSLATCSILFKFVALLILVSSCTPSSNHQKAIHPALDQLEAVKFLSIDAMMSVTGAGHNYKISPNGKWISWEAFDSQERFAFGFRERTGNGKIFTLFSTEPAYFFWGNFDQFIYLATGGRMYRFDANDLNNPHIDVTPRGFIHWDIALIPESANERWHIKSHDRNPAFVDIYSVEPDGSDRKLVVKNSGKYIGWNVNQFGKFFGQRSRLDDGGTLHEFTEEPVHYSANTKWFKSFQTRPDEHFNAIASPDEDGNILSMSNRGRDKIALVKLDPGTGTETIVAENSHSDVSRVFTSDKAHVNPALVWYAAGYSTPSATNTWGEKFLKLLKRENPVTKYVDIISHSLDHRFIVVELVERFAGRQYHLFDMLKNTRAIIGHSPILAHKIPISPTKTVSIPASDQTSLPSILTRPGGLLPKKGPMVVLVHGGPSNYDRIKPDLLVHMLTNRGYSVLQVNYRGSTGFGKLHQSAGYRQFGRAIQKDLVDSVHWAINEEIADPEKIAVVGNSFGGYASLMSLARDGDLFAAGVSVNGVTDLEYQTKNNPFTWQLFGYSWKRYFGDPEFPADAELMKQFSPVTLAENITKPLLLVHGKRDRIVSVEQSEKLEKLLTGFGNPPVSFYVENEGHKFNRYAAIRSSMAKIDQFLAKHLGGRSGIYDD